MFVGYLETLARHVTSHPRPHPVRLWTEKTPDENAPKEPPGLTPGRPLGRGPKFPGREELINEGPFPLRSRIAQHLGLRSANFDMFFFEKSFSLFKGTLNFLGSSWL